MSNANAIFGNTLVRALAALAIGAASAAAQADPVIYSQAENLSANALIFSSENDTTPGGFGNFSTVYDDFSFANGATVTDVHWVGGFFGGNEANGNITGFTVQFWSDAAGTPGGSLSSQHFAGNGGQAGAHTCSGIFTCFNYGVDLTTSFAATAGTTYWVSIVADQAFQPNWGLLQATTGGNAVQDFFTGRNIIPDIAFSLTGAEDDVAVPEPATLALLGLGLAGLGFSRRRKEC